MTNNNDRIDQLLSRLEILLRRQEDFSKEVKEVQEEINALKILQIKQNTEKEETTEKRSVPETVTEIRKDKVTADFQPVEKQAPKEPLKSFATKADEQSRIKADLEKFIGENLINKIGIVITVIGVSIGAKYAIDHELISPLTRIILGYLIGLGLLFFAIRLKKNYENFSAVLLSGSMAIMYFITYAAFSFYGLFPQAVTFALMVIITVFTVLAAINYNQQVIAHIGLVGAYAIPFLLNQGPSDFMVLFSYTAIINIGILFISFKKYWKPLYYASFLITWLMYLSWFWQGYKPDENLGLASAFLSIFFLTFYLMFLAYKLLQKEKFDVFDVILLLANSFIFYGVGYRILSTNATGEHLLGLFTFSNAIVHFIVSVIIYRQKLADRNLYLLVAGLVLIFITIAIPVQLNGNWVTLLWSGEAALLFWIGRTQKVKFYELLSYALMFFAFFSLLQDWAAARYTFSPDNFVITKTPLFNIGFLTSILFVASFSFINALNHNPKYPSPFIYQKELFNLISYSISTALLIACYYSFKNEISLYWDQLYNSSYTEVTTAGQLTPDKYWNKDLLLYKNIWLINYTLLFLSVLSVINIKKLVSRNWGLINLGLNTIAMMVFLMYGLYELSELRVSYLNQTLSELYHRGPFNIVIRYISFVFAGLMLASIKMYIDKEFLKPVPFNIKMAFDIILYTSLIWIISSELISWMDIIHYTQSYKLVLSILWGVYSLAMIGLGIKGKKKHLRVGAISLFALTLIKLFFYDLTHLDTISKTIVFVTLGVLLLIISFLYNKYRNVIYGDEGS